MKKLIFLIVAISLFTFKANAQIDSVKIIQIISPVDSISFGSTVFPTIMIENCGFNTLDSLNVLYTMNGGLPVMEILQSSILPNDTVIYSFTQAYTSPNTNYIICFKVFNRYASDSTCKTVIATTPLNDVGVREIINPPVSQIIIPGDSLCFEVWIKNYGLNSQTNIPVEYQISTLPAVQEICSDTIASKDSVLFTFATPIISGVGSMLACVRTVLPSDSVFINDEICIMYNGWSIPESHKNTFTLSQNYPNPASNSTTISYLSQTSGTATFTVRDIQGKLIYQSQEKAQIGENSIILNTEEFSGGIYYYSLQLGDEIQTKSFMIKD